MYEKESADGPVRKRRGFINKGGFFLEQRGREKGFRRQRTAPFVAEGRKMVRKRPWARSFPRDRNFRGEEKKEPENCTCGGPIGRRENISKEGGVTNIALGKKKKK